MRVGSLFSGIGGFDLGLERNGFDIRWQCEIDTAAQSVLRRHWPDAVLYDDVTTLGGDVEPVDLICGGFPCQDLSVAGKRAGLAGKRSGLFYEFMRIADELAPRWLLIENVPGLLSSNGGRDMGAVLGTLGELGYGWAYRVLDAQFFGVAQRRRRVFIVGCLGNPARAAEVLFEPESCAGDSPPRREAGARVTPLLEIGARTSGDGYRDGDGIGDEGAPMYTLQAGKQHGVAAAVCSKWAKGTGGPSGDECQKLVAIAQNQRGELRTGEIMPQLTCGGGKPGEGYPCVAMTSEMSPQTECCPTLKAKPGGLGYHANVGMAVRRLTPTECERLQGFPDGWTAEGSNGPQSDSARYRQLGNAVCVPVAEWIGRRIVEVAA